MWCQPLTKLCQTWEKHWDTFRDVKSHLWWCAESRLVTRLQSITVPTALWLQAAEVSSWYWSSRVGEMFYKLIILLSGSSAVLLCSCHATIHLRYKLSSPVHNHARSSTFVIWCRCAFSLPAAGSSAGDPQVPNIKTYFCTYHTLSKWKSKINEDTHVDIISIGQKKKEQWKETDTHKRLLFIMMFFF